MWHPDHRESLPRHWYGNLESGAEHQIRLRGIDELRHRDSGQDVRYDARPLSHPARTLPQHVKRAVQYQVATIEKYITHL